MTVTVFVGGRIYPMASDALAAAEALAVEDGRITRVGTRADVLHAAGPGADVVELDGRALLPGFIDPHHHMCIAVFHESCVDVRPAVAPDLATLKARIARAAAALPSDVWVVAGGYDEILLRERRHPTREDLDAACSDRPVLLMHYSCHEGIANTRALELAGIDPSTPDPAGGAIVRDRRGRPSGRLIELAFVRVEVVARTSRTRANEADVIARMIAHQQKAFAAGLTRVVDPMVSPETELLYRRAREGGLLKIPLTMMPIGSHGLAVPPRDRLSGDTRTGDGPDDFRVGPMKLVFDGAGRCAMCMTIPEVVSTSLRSLVRAIETGSTLGLRAALDSDLRRDGGLVRTGIRYYTREEGRSMIGDALGHGFGLASHAIGNEAIETVLDLYREQRVTSVALHPPRIEHAMVLDDDLVRKIADQGVAVVMQPDFVRVPMLAAATLPTRFKLFPVKTLRAAGVRVAGSSDAPVQPSFEPLVGVQAAVSRSTHDGGALHPEEALDVYDALALYTREAAYAAGCLDCSGTLERGKRADLVVLSHDPCAPGADLAKLRVVETFVGGESVFRASS